MKKSRLRPYLIMACTWQLIATLLYLLAPNFHSVILSTYALALSWLFFHAQKKHSWRQLILFSFALALEFTLIIQILSHTVFSGLAKDISFLSIENAFNAVKLSLVLLGLYTGWLFCIRCFTQLIHAKEN